MRNQTSDLQIPRSNPLPLSHRDSTVSEVYYKVHMTRVLHTTRISNVASVMFVDRNKRDSIRTPQEHSYNVSLENLVLDQLIIP